MEVGLLAAVLGLSVALAPGPSLALACANTLRGGVRAGISTSVAAALADLAIAVVSVVILFSVGDRPASFVGVIGGLMVLGFGVDSLVVSRRRDPVPRGAATHRKFVQAALLELSLPQALLFGLTAVGPTITHLRDSDDTWPWALVGLLVLAMLVARLLVVAQVARTNRFLDRRAYRQVCRGAGASLLLVGAAMTVWLGSYALGAR